MNPRILPAFALLSLPAAAQTVWSVTPAQGPGALQATADLASSGDVLEVAPGVYDGLALDGKALTVIGLGANPSDVVLSPAATSTAPILDLRNAPASSVTWIANLELSGGSPEESGITLSDSAGVVLLEDLVVQPSRPNSSHPAVLVEDSAFVSLRNLDVEFDSQFVGTGPDSAVSLHAVEWNQSNGTIADSRLVGAEGGSVFSAVFVAGGSGLIVGGGSQIRVSNVEVLGATAEWGSFQQGSIGPGLLVGGQSEVRISGGSGNLIRGGDGFIQSPGGPFEPPLNIDGAAGIYVVTGSSVWLGSDVQVIGGMDGEGLVAAAATFGPVTTGSAASPNLAVTPSRAQLGGNVQLTTTGEPGAALLRAVSGAPAGPLELLPGGPWSLLDLGGLVILGSGSLDGTGQNGLGLPIPTQPSLAWKSVWFQVFTVVSTGGGAVLETSGAEALLITG